MELAKQRIHAASQRTTIGHFIQKKFGWPEVASKLAEYGCVPGSLGQIVVTWDSDVGVQEIAKANSIEIWHFRDLIGEITSAVKRGRVYYTDDTLRTLHSLTLAQPKT